MDYGVAVGGGVVVEESGGCGAAMGEGMATTTARAHLVGEISGRQAGEGWVAGASARSWRGHGVTGGRPP
jgi:hypothetical protein